MTERLPDNPLQPGVAGRFYIGSDGGFTAEQYADMCLTQLFESAKHYPLPLKIKVLEAKAEMALVLNRYFAEAMADATRRVGRHYELQEKKKARLMLPSGMGQRLDDGGVWDEALAPASNP